MSKICETTSIEDLIDSSQELLPEGLLEIIDKVSNMIKPVEETYEVTSESSLSCQAE